MKAAIQTLVGGFLLGSLPFLLSKIPWQPPWLLTVQDASALLLLPGMLVDFL